MPNEILMKHITEPTLSKFELHLNVESADTNALELLKTHCELPVSQIKAAVAKGALWLEKGKSVKRFRRIKKALAPNNKLHFYFDEKILNQEVEDAILLADYDDYSIWYKPYGMLSHGSKWSEHTTITRFVSEFFEHQRPVFLVHRLDRAAQGIIVVAHTKSATRELAKLFEHHNLTKIYWAICHNNTLDNQERIIELPIDEKPAKSTVEVIDYNVEDNITLVSINIETGRKHQIRKHLASINMPIVGDRLHGHAISDSETNLQLCAVHLSFSCPITEREVNINLPENLIPNIQDIQL